MPDIYLSQVPAYAGRADIALSDPAALDAGASVVGAGGIASSQGLGGPTLRANVEAGGVASLAAVGAPVLRLVVYAAGVPTAAAVGQPIVSASSAAIVGAGGIASAAAVGSPDVQPVITGGTATVFDLRRYARQPAHGITGAGGIASGAAVGRPDIVPGRLTPAARRRKDELELMLMAA